MPSKEGKTIRLLNDAIVKLIRVKESAELDSSNRENVEKAIDDIINVIEVNRKLKEILDSSL
jgi:hypothetical protein